MTLPDPSHPAYPVPRRAESAVDDAAAPIPADDPRAQLYLAFRDGRPFIASHRIAVGRVVEAEAPPTPDRAQLSLFGR